MHRIRLVAAGLHVAAVAEHDARLATNLNVEALPRMAAQWDRLAHHKAKRVDGQDDKNCVS